MQRTATPPSGANRLRCFPEADPPPGLAADLGRLLALEEAEREGFWEVLGAYLKPHLDDAAQEAIVGYCTKHGLSTDAIAGPIRASRFLFQEAAKVDLSKDDFAADLAAVLGEDDAPQAIALLVPWYEDYLPRLRRDLVHQTLTDHDKLVVGTRWRLERILTSDRAAGLGITMATLTFTYHEGEETKRVSLKFLPEELDALRKAADRLLPS